jgi:predicted transcriptional regulator
LIESIESPYSLFVYAIRSPVTKDCYQRRLRRFFDFISIEHDNTMKERINAFAEKANRDDKWAFNSIASFLQHQKERVDRKEIVVGTLEEGYQLEHVKDVKGL